MAQIVNNVGTGSFSEDKDVGTGNSFLIRSKLTKFVFDERGVKYRIVQHAHPNRYEDVIFCEPVDERDEEYYDWENKHIKTVEFNVHDGSNPIFPNTESVRDLLKIRKQIAKKLENVDQALNAHYHGMFQAHYIDPDKKKRKKQKKRKGSK